MYGCEILFDVETAASVRTELTKALGECPCFVGRTCPLLPADLGPLLDRKRTVPVVEETANQVLNTREERVASAEPARHSGPRLPTPRRTLGIAQEAC